MDAGEAALHVLREAPGEELHWTVIWDRALRGGLIDPLADRDARATLQRALARAAADGVIERPSKGTYRSASGTPDPGAGGAG